MQLKKLMSFVLALPMAAASTVARSGSASDCPVWPTQKYTMAVLMPCGLQIVTANQRAAPSLQTIATAPFHEYLRAAPIPVWVRAPGMSNVEVWMHGRFAQRLTAGADDLWHGTLDLSTEPNGPLVLAIYAWDSAPGDDSYTVHLAARQLIFVHDSTVPYKIPQVPAGAAGMKLAWSEEFDTLSATPCKPQTGVWPRCQRPSASDGFIWFENKPNGGDFGSAAFEHTDSPYSPYTIMWGNPTAQKEGFLRIRSSYDPNYVDPYGWGRHWRSGLLASAFPDGSTNVPNLANGYYEARILAPNGYPNGGTWPGWWMMDLNAFELGATGSLEIDIMEEYGANPHYTQAGQHSYGTAMGGSWIYHGDPGSDLTWDFHRHGMLITDSAVTYYLDDDPLGSAPRAQLTGNPPVTWFLILNLAMGSGYPVNPPPASYYDMWIDYVRYYTP